MRPDVLPPAQRAFWDEDVPTLPRDWVLYGGTAIALHLGHRRSLDFDFFSADTLDRVSAGVPSSPRQRRYRTSRTPSP